MKKMKWNSVEVPLKNMTKLINQKYYSQFAKNLHQSAEDDYKKAIATLNLLQTNAHDLSGPQIPQFLESKLDRFRSLLSFCGINVRQIEEQLSVIHVSGTKGKGSTCVFCETMLENYGFKTGFYTSPHMVSVRERIRVNGKPISKEKFSKCFWDVHSQLMSSQENGNNEMPPYFMFLTIMGFKVFFEEKVDVAILEVGVGGEYDYTNVLSNTAVVGISSLGIDHVKVLGDTLEQIAFQKSGIMKPGCVAISSPNQPSAALNVLQERAAEKKCDFFVAPTLDKYSLPDGTKLGIGGPAQKQNASLAIQLVNAWMDIRKCGTFKGPTLNVSKEMLEGLANSRWPGRTQSFHFSSNLTYYMDGAHTLESMQNCLAWFQNTALVSSASRRRVLVFNMTKSRDPKALMELFVPIKFDHVFFCTNRVSSSIEDIFKDNTDFRTTPGKDYETMASYLNEWSRLTSKQDEKTVEIFLDVSSVHERLVKLSDTEKLDVLVTGSLHLVGAFLTILDPNLKCGFKAS